MKWSWKTRWPYLVIFVLIVGVAAWFYFTPTPANRKFRQAIERITNMNLNVTHSINSSGPSDGSGSDGSTTKGGINDILLSMKDFNEMAHDSQLPYLQRAMAISWITNLYRVGWGPYQRNEEMARRWAQAAGLRLWNPGADLDFMDRDDRTLPLPIYDPPVLSWSERKKQMDKRTSQQVQHQLDQMQQRVQQEVVNHQNVHNSGVTQSVAETLQHYRYLNPNAIYDTSVQQSIQQVRQLILSSQKAPEDQKQRALQTLDRIETSETPLVRTGLTESQILSLVWNRRHDLRMTDDQSIDLLIDRLSDSVEHGHVVCTTGRVSHMVDTWSGIDDRVKLQTVEQRKQERLTAVQQHVNDMVGLFHPNDQRRWNDATDDITDLRNRITQHVMLRMGPLSEPEQQEIRSWIDAL